MKKQKNTSVPLTMANNVLANSTVATQYWQTQLAGVSKNTRPILTIIGLDFGTAFTKVVVHLPIAQEHYAIPLNDSEKGLNQYLLPTSLYQNSVGTLSVSKPEDCQRMYTDFKMRILDGTLDAQTRGHIVTYLAYVLQKSRQWLLTKKQSVLNQRYLSWTINIGLPTAKYNEKGTDLKEQYCALVDDAWQQSTRQPHGRKDMTPSNNDADKLPAGRINASPEFVAQIRSYLQSAQLKSGLHALVDVGAGTVDVTGFTLPKNKTDWEKSTYIFSSSVKPLGTSYLAKRRCSTADKACTWHPNPQEPSLSREEFAEKLGVPQATIARIDKEFKTDLGTQANSVLIQACKQFYEENKPATTADREEARYPFMLCGGGARVEFYDSFYPDELITEKKLKDTLQGNVYKTGFPELENLKSVALSSPDRSRLSVAHGLSFDAATIKIRYPSPITPISKNPEARRRKTCPKCRGTGNASGNCLQCDGTGAIWV